MASLNTNDNQSQFIVNNGIVYNKRDILLLMRDLGNVTYLEISGGKVANKGKGYVMRVCANSEEPTLFLGGRIYINVGSFNYLKLSKIKGQENTLFELIKEDRVIQIIPDDANRSFPSTSKETFAERMLGWGKEEGGLPDSASDMENPFNDEWFEN